MTTITYIKSILSVLFVFSITCSIQSQTIVTDSGDLQDLVNAANPGETFIVKNGDYTDFEASFSAIGTEDNPITIKAESIGGVTLAGDSHFVFKKSAHIIIEGFIFDCDGDSTLIKLEGSNNIRITRNVFELRTTASIKWVFIGGIYNDYTFQHTSHHNRIDHNIFKNKTTPGHYITIDGTSNEDRSDSRQSQYDRIDHNYFMNNSPRAANEQESIRVGWSQMSMSSGFTTIEHNLFEDCDGDPEIVSIKSSDNIIRHNTFKRSYGTLSLRHGNRNRVEGNYFFGDGKANGTFGTSTIHTGGIRIYGTDHVIVNNYMEGLKGTIWDAPIALTQGDAIDGSSTNLTKHFRAERVTIAYNTLVNNTYGIEIGYDKNGDYNKKLEDIIIANNVITGSENNLVHYIDGNDQNGEITWINNILYPTGSASLVNGGPDFSDTEITNTNPNLSFDGVIWESTDASPILASGIPSLGINQDIEGQSRPENSTVGADHFSMETARFNPLTPNDVGPNAYEDGDTPVDNLFVSSISDFESVSGSQVVTVTSNTNWTASDDSDWVSVTPLNGTNNGSIEIIVQENFSLEQRTGIVTIIASSINRTISVLQKGADAPNGSEELTIIEVLASSEQQPDNTKDKTLDKDFDTRWSAEGVGENITYNLGGSYDISLVKIAVHKGTDRFTYFDIATSLDGTNFTTILANQSSSGTSNGLENYLLNSQAQYVRIIGGGNSASAWNSITEVEIYGINSLLSIEENELSAFRMHPIPASDNLKVNNLKENFTKVSIFNLTGSKVLSQVIQNEEDIILDVSGLNSGLYILQFSNDKRVVSKKIIISR
ncbi:chondroitinase-B domain-containing protein [Aquimarina sp. 2201CG14-23]|uniref:chondroitinase-B domain-containing protein n=1 Tax=Aquimarina mycalae TaxID=3040073 RepID=UPI002477D9D5|nr:chondroitinase-B domain-containing protein [Aquimarina sp. 2201CG14-23]MDH7446523.1 chondroitinase-B domain-containing protein [Aquimarina sp. 2201CG14-23]